MDQTQPALVHITFNFTIEGERANKMNWCYAQITTTYETECTSNRKEWYQLHLYFYTCEKNSENKQTTKTHFAIDAAHKI